MSILPPGETHMNLGNYVEAEAYYRKALAAKPEHIPAHLTMAKLMHKLVHTYTHSLFDILENKKVFFTLLY